MMKNITLSAQADKIETLRDLARRENKTVNQLFREWLDSSVAKKESKQRTKDLKVFKESVKRIDYVKLDRKYTREEMNQR
ncbi:MAG: hypothetical protein ACR2FM_03465 [Candidatus Saccharimonadales bacterium]